MKKPIITIFPLLIVLLFLSFFQGCSGKRSALIFQEHLYQKKSQFTKNEIKDSESNRDSFITYVVTDTTTKFDSTVVVYDNSTLNHRVASYEAIDKYRVFLGKINFTTNLADFVKEQLEFITISDGISFDKKDYETILINVNIDSFSISTKYHVYRSSSTNANYSRETLIDKPVAKISLTINAIFPNEKSYTRNYSNEFIGLINLGCSSVQQENETQNQMIMYMVEVFSSCIREQAELIVEDIYKQINSN